MSISVFHKAVFSLFSAKDFLFVDVHDIHIYLLDVYHIHIIWIICLYFSHLWPRFIRFLYNCRILECHPCFHSVGHTLLLHPFLFGLCFFVTIATSTLTYDINIITSSSCYLSYFYISFCSFYCGGNSIMNKTINKATGEKKTTYF